MECTKVSGVDNLPIAPCWENAREDILSLSDIMGVILISTERYTGSDWMPSGVVLDMSIIAIAAMTMESVTNDPNSDVVVSGIAFGRTKKGWVSLSRDIADRTAFIFEATNLPTVNNCSLIEGMSSVEKMYQSIVNVTHLG